MQTQTDIQKQVFVVDDSHLICLTVEKILSQWCQVFTFLCASDMFELMGDVMPDLILMDILMPEMTGFEAIKILKSDERYQTIPVMFLTGRTDIDTEAKSFELGAVDFITKPIVEPILHSRVKTQLSIRELIRETALKSEFQRTLFNAAPIGLCIFDDTMAPVDCNEYILKLFGTNITKEYFLENFYILHPKTQPNGVDSLVEIHAHLKRAFAGERIKTEWVHSTPSDELIPCEITLVRVPQGDQYICLAYMYDLRTIKSLEEKAQSAYYDALTGIHNRRYLDENLPGIMRSLSRSNSMLCIMMVDIDRFKDYNDTFGHNGGDECLKTIAQTLANNVGRADDFVARYGGEEFTIVLPNTDEEGGRKVAERMLKAIRDKNIPHPNSGIASHVTFSIGIATGTVTRNSTPGEFIKRADEMLYTAKQNGRNRYELAMIG